MTEWLRATLVPWLVMVLAQVVPPLVMPPLVMPPPFRPRPRRIPAVSPP